MVESPSRNPAEVRLAPEFSEGPVFKLSPVRTCKKARQKCTTQPHPERDWKQTFVNHAPQNSSNVPVSSLSSFSVFSHHPAVLQLFSREKGTLPIHQKTQLGKSTRRGLVRGYLPLPTSSRLHIGIHSIGPRQRGVALRPSYFLP